MAAEDRPVTAFGPGRVNLIGEHTDYNGGLALPFAIAQGVTVHAARIAGARIRARALDLGEVAELSAAGVVLRPAELQIRGEVPRGAGLSSSAALAVALGLALLALADT